MHLALICPDLTGHLNPMTTLGAALKRRGHRVSLVATPQSRSKAEASELDFLPVGVQEHEQGDFIAEQETLGRLTGWPALRFTVQILCRNAEITLRDVPKVLENNGVDGVVVDQVTPAGWSVANVLKLPDALVCNALALHQEPAVPPPVTGWSLRDDWIGRWRNRLGNRLLTFAARPMARVVNRYRRKHGLPAVRLTDSRNVGIVQLAQQPAFFDFPREQLPEHFHYTGPWHAAGRDNQVSFPWDKINGRPLVYASLGTLQNRLRHVFAAIIDACHELDVQLVMSLGRADAEWNEPTPPGTIVVPYAPQLELLERATAVVTHAGLNTALETLSRGLPMVAIPVTNDQPGVASRLKWLNTAEVVKPNRANRARLRAAIERIINGSSYHDAARDCQQKLQAGPTVDTAAELIERALSDRVQLTRAAMADSPPLCQTAKVD